MDSRKHLASSSHSVLLLGKIVVVRVQFCQMSDDVFCCVIAIWKREPAPRLVIGLYDGNVAVYNLQRDTTKPSFLSTAVNGKHRELVWQVRWAPDNDDGYLNFHSTSGDGRVSNWILVKVSTPNHLATS